MMVTTESSLAPRWSQGPPMIPGAHPVCACLGAIIFGVLLRLCGALQGKVSYWRVATSRTLRGKH